MRSPADPSPAGHLSESGCWLESAECGPWGASGSRRSSPSVDDRVAPRETSVLIGFKLTLLGFILVAGWAGGAIPLSAGPRIRAGRLLGWANGFAAGVFLGTGLAHMLADASRSWTALGYEYPVGFVLATAAFVAMLLFEHVLLPESAHAVVHAESGEPFSHAHVPVAQGPLISYAIVAALSVHSLIAGLALGAAQEVAGALVIFLAIIAHKSTAGLALGVSLARDAIPRSRAYRLLALFSVATPIGIGIGIWLGDLLQGRGQQTAEAAFLALAAGTFVYVASFDILRDEFLEPGGRFGKWLSVAMGTALTGTLAIWV